MSEDLTFKEIAQVALGSIDFSDANIPLLYALINLLLKKLNCENEVVMISGVPAGNLQELLCKSQTGPPLIFREEKMETPLDPFEKMDELEKQIQNFETNLEEHQEQVKFLRYVSDDPEETALGLLPCALFCDVEETKNEMTSKLIKNEWFLMQLNEFCKFPFICRFNKLDIKFRALGSDIKKFQKECTHTLKRINKMEDLFVDLLEIQKAVGENNIEILTTMEEIQEAMDSKVDNIQMPPLKRSILSILKRLSNEANYLKYVKMKPRALACIADPIATGKVSRSIVRRFAREPRIENYCGCDELAVHATLTERLEIMDKNAVLRRSTNETISFKDSRTRFSK